MTFNFLRHGLTVNVEAKVQEQIILDSSVSFYYSKLHQGIDFLWNDSGRIPQTVVVVKRVD